MQPRRPNSDNGTGRMRSPSNRSNEIPGNAPDLKRSAPKSGQKSNITIFAGTVVALLGITGFFWTVHLDDLRKAKAEAAARAVAVLPQGTEEAWTTYVDRRFTDAIQPQGDLLKVVGMGDKITRQTTVVSRGTPYRITCNPVIGVSVNFATGGDGTQVPIYGLMDLEPAGRHEPALGVSPNSVAAAHLGETLCARVTAHMQALSGR